MGDCLRKPFSTNKAVWLFLLLAFTAVVVLLFPILFYEDPVHTVSHLVYTDDYPSLYADELKMIFGNHTPSSSSFIYPSQISPIVTFFSAICILYFLLMILNMSAQKKFDCSIIDSIPLIQKYPIWKKKDPFGREYYGVSNFWGMDANIKEDSDLSWLEWDGNEINIYVFSYFSTTSYFMGRELYFILMIAIALYFLFTLAWQVWLQRRHER